MLKLFLLLIIVLPISINAEERTDFISNTTISINDNTTTKLNDNNYNTYTSLTKDDLITITSPIDIYHIYIIYYLETATGTMNDEYQLGTKNFLHEAISLDTPTKELKIQYDENVKIKEIFVFEKNLPDWVQTWQEEHDKPDIILLSTHSDDEHLFYAGLIPTMIANNKKIQIVYLARHTDTPTRFDELLNGLWAVGVRNYPTMGIIPDAYSESLKGATNNINKANISIDDVIKFQVDVIRKFQPKVVVGHDINGEYGHGQHILNTHTLIEALKVVNDENYLTDYEPYEPYKVYLHLYEENPIVMDYDTPLDYYNGLTAYEVSKLGYNEHESQHWTWFTRWMLGSNKEFTKATDIKTYSPVNYGLYFSTVGYENKDGDMFYNIPEEKETEQETIKEIENDTPQTPDSTHEEKADFTIYYVVASIIILGIVILILKK